MATAYIEVTVVDVGQGQCTFIQTFDSSDRNLQNIIMDAGGSGYTSGASNAKHNLTYIANKLTINESTVRPIDCLIFSHSDSDHINLMRYLLEMLPVAPKIHTVWYGGAYSLYKKSSFNILDEIVRIGCCKKEQLHSPPANSTGFSTSTYDFTKIMWQNGDKDVDVVLIAGNTIEDKQLLLSGEDEPLPTTDSEDKNMVSIICGLRFKKHLYVMCGDAIYTTMSAVNKTVGLLGLVGYENIMLTIPHHGSRKTGLGVDGGVEASSSAVDVAKSFGISMMPITCTASSKESGSYKHPSYEVMRYISPSIFNSKKLVEDKRIDGSNLHYLAANIDVTLKYPNSSGVITNNKGYSNVQSSTNIFTTLYTVDALVFKAELTRFSDNKVTTATALKSGSSAINTGACWIYRSYSNGNYAMLGVDKLGGTQFTQVPTSSSMRTAVSKQETGPKKSKQYRPAVNRGGFGRKIIKHF